MDDQIGYVDLLLWTSKSNDEIQHMKILEIDDGFLNGRIWFQDDLNAVLDVSNNLFNDTSFFFSFAQSCCFTLEKLLPRI